MMGGWVLLLLMLMLLSIMILILLVMLLVPGQSVTKTYCGKVVGVYRLCDDAALPQRS